MSIKCKSKLLIRNYILETKRSSNHFVPYSTYLLCIMSASLKVPSQSWSPLQLLLSLPLMRLSWGVVGVELCLTVELQTVDTALPISTRLSRDTAVGVAICGTDKGVVFVLLLAELLGNP